MNDFEIMSTIPAYPKFYIAYFGCFPLGQVESCDADPTDITRIIYGAMRHGCTLSEQQVRQAIFNVECKNIPAAKAFELAKKYNLTFPEQSH